MSSSRYSNGHRRRELVKRVKARGLPCWICGLPIPPDAPSGSPLAFELDELVPVSKGGSPIDPENVAGAHRCCNQWRGNRSVRDVEVARADAMRAGGWSSPTGFCSLARSVKAGLRRAPIRHPKRSSGSL